MTTLADTTGKRLKVLLSAYACEPGKGSEPGVGWNAAIELAALHDVWVLTRSNNRQVIEFELARHPVKNLHFVYYDLPKWVRWWKRGAIGIQLYYYLWQLFNWKTIEHLNNHIHFDLAHHITFGKYWAPSSLPRLHIPFVWGSVGGGETMPASFLRNCPFKEKLLEITRLIARRVEEHDPFVRRTAKASSIAIGATPETAERLKIMGCSQVRSIPQCALTSKQYQILNTLPPAPKDIFRFISIGRAFYWKGFHLGLEAFAKANIKGAEYWIIANGKGIKHLKRLSTKLGIADRVKFYQDLPTLQAVYDLLTQCHVLVHPALHEAFGNVVLESMAAGRPVICLDMGGPGLQVSEGTGIKIKASSPCDAIASIAKWMSFCVENTNSVKTMGERSKKRVLETMLWKKRRQDYDKAYRLATDPCRQS